MKEEEDLLRLLPPPEGVDLSDAGAPADAAPAFSFSAPSSPSSSFISPLSPEPTVSHRFTITFNKQQKGIVNEEEEEDEVEEKESGPRYFVEGFSQRPSGLDDPRRPSLLETETMESAMRSSSSAAAAANSSNSKSSEKEKTWNLLRHPLGAVVEMRLRNDDDVEHSWHLHGHNFWLVEGGEEKREGGTTTTEAAITEARDTVLIPSKSEIRARYVADSPGAFLAHCHMSWHEAAGLAVVMVDGLGIGGGGGGGGERGGK